MTNKQKKNINKCETESGKSEFRKTYQKPKHQMKQQQHT